MENFQGDFLVWRMWECDDVECEECAGSRHFERSPPEADGARNDDSRHIFTFPHLHIPTFFKQENRLGISPCDFLSRDLNYGLVFLYKSPFVLQLCTKIMSYLNCHLSTISKGYGSSGDIHKQLRAGFCHWLFWVMCILLVKLLNSAVSPGN